MDTFALIFCERMTAIRFAAKVWTMLVCKAINNPPAIVIAVRSIINNIFSPFLIFLIFTANLIFSPGKIMNIVHDLLNIMI